METPRCPSCEGSSVRNGKRRGKQSYLCQFCLTQFIPLGEQSPRGRKKIIGHPAQPAKRRLQ